MGLLKREGLGRLQVDAVVSKTLRRLRRCAELMRLHWGEALLRQVSAGLGGSLMRRHALRGMRALPAPAANSPQPAAGATHAANSFPLPVVLPCRPARRAGCPSAPWR